MIGSRGWPGWLALLHPEHNSALRIEPGGTERWQVTLANNINGPVVGPTNTMLVMGSANTLNYAGTIQAVSTTRGQALFSR